MHHRIIPSSGELLPILGLGTWSTFDVTGTNAIQPLHEVLQVMHKAGGKLIDSSPMYGNAESVIGELSMEIEWHNDLFYATKVWTTGKEAGKQQMESSFRKMKRKTMDLMQIHNLVDWKTHLQTLREWKAAGKIRYIGITHYTDAMHGELEKIIAKEEIDFVQFNYSIFATNAEKTLLPMAADNGVATLINRPFGEGHFFAKVKNKALPAWAMDAGIKTWSQFILLYIMAHPAVTCIIPATSDPAHASENYAAGNMELPDEAMRQRMRKEIL